MIIKKFLSGIVSAVFTAAAFITPETMNDVKAVDSAVSLKDVYRAYYSELTTNNEYNEDEVVVPYYLFDVNNDGIEEMLRLNSNERYVIYSYKNGSIVSDEFGKYMAMGSGDHLSIAKGYDGKTYIHYFDSYAYKEMEGYYSPDTGKSIDAFTDYKFFGYEYDAYWYIGSNADSSTWFEWRKDDSTNAIANGNDIRSGFNNNSEVYKTALSQVMSDNGFTIDAQSETQRIPSMKYSEIANKLIELYNNNDTANNDFNGDFNGDGKIDLEDVIAICRYITGSRSIMNMRTSLNGVSGDVSGNGKIDLYDAIDISKYIIENDLYDKNSKCSGKISGENIEIESGTTSLNIPLYIQNADSYGAFVKIISPDGFTLKDISDALSFDEKSSKAVIASGTVFKTDKPFVNLKFDVSKDVASGTYPIKIEIFALDDNGECGYGGIVTAASITVKEAYIKGDISGNGKIDLYDAIEIAKSLIGKRKFTDEQKKIADFNGDGKVDLYDAIGIAKYLLKRK